MTETQRNDSRVEQTFHDTRVTDSVYVHDSVFIRLAGDTVVQLRWRTIWRDRIVHDTVVERVTDTVRVVQTVEKTVAVSAKPANAVFAAAIVLLLMAVIILLFLKRI